MVQLTRFPNPAQASSWQEFAHLLVQVLQTQLGSIEETSPGSIIVFQGAVPQGYLLADGSSFDAKTYPALAHFLGGTLLPNMGTLGPFSFGVKAK